MDMKAWIVGAIAAVIGAAAVIASLENKQPPASTTASSTSSSTSTSPVVVSTPAANVQSNKYYGTPLSGLGTQAQPYQTQPNGLLDWMGNGYYQLTIPSVMGTKAGEYLITNQSFVTNYDANAKILGY